MTPAKRSTAKPSRTATTRTRRDRAPDEPPEFPDSFRVLHVYVSPGKPLRMEGDHFEPYELRAIADFLAEEAAPPEIIEEEDA